jgi:type VI secretion system secreted protein VgrG
VHGTQTAVVTAEAGQDQEINVGGPADVGCVRVRFHWDRDAARHRSEPTSCWLRVSQMFAGGRGHGAMFHPRVGDEVVVDYLEGDPDQPIVTGRVYNGRNLSPENATGRPTYSCIKSMTSPFNGNYNMIAFDDLQNEEKFIVHAARDYIEEILHDSSRSVANFDSIKVFGDQSVWIKGSQTIEVLSPQTILVRSDQTTVITGHQAYTVGSGLDLTVVGTFAEKVSGTKVEMAMTRTATIQTMDSLEAPLIQRRGSSIVDQATMITVNGSVITISGGHMTVKADKVDVVGGVVNVASAGAVNVNGKSGIMLNC